MHAKTPPPAPLGAPATSPTKIPAATPLLANAITTSRKPPRAQSAITGMSRFSFWSVAYRASEPNEQSRASATGGWLSTAIWTFKSHRSIQNPRGSGRWLQHGVRPMPRLTVSSELKSLPAKGDGKNACVRNSSYAGNNSPMCSNNPRNPRFRSA